MSDGFLDVFQKVLKKKKKPPAVSSVPEYPHPLAISTKLVFLLICSVMLTTALFPSFLLFTSSAPLKKPSKSTGTEP